MKARNARALHILLICFHEIMAGPYATRGNSGHFAGAGVPHQRNGCPSALAVLNWTVSPITNEPDEPASSQLIKQHLPQPAWKRGAEYRISGPTSAGVAACAIAGSAQEESGRAAPGTVGLIWDSDSSFIGLLTR